jgi:hypothetical protein
MLLGACLAAAWGSTTEVEAQGWLCPQCGVGELVIVQRLPPGCAIGQQEPGIEDSS